MAVNLSPYGGVGTQFFDNSGNVLTGGKIFTYAGGTTTPQVTYTTNAGNIPHPNPIILDASGRVPSGGEIWLTDGLVYKFILRDANDVLIATYDGVSGINSNFVAFTNQQEIQTATAGQTVFDLTTMSYQPGTNSLSVFVDGVNQYGPGAQYAYLETDSDTITFLSGLHVGAEVKFTTSQLNTSGSTNDAFQVSYTPPFTNSVATNVGAKLAQTISVKDFGAVGDGLTDDTVAIQNAIDYAWNANNDLVFFPAGRYLVTNTINLHYGTKLSGVNINYSGFAGTTSFPNAQSDSQGSVILFRPTTQLDLFVPVLPKGGSIAWTGIAITNLNIWGNTTPDAYWRSVLGGDFAADVSYSRYAIDFQAVTAGTVENVSIVGFQYGIVEGSYTQYNVYNQVNIQVIREACYYIPALTINNEPTSPSFTNCVFRTCKHIAKAEYNPSVSFSGSNLHVRFTNCYFEATSSHGFVLTAQSREWTFVDCYGESIGLDSSVTDRSCFYVGVGGTQFNLKSLTVFGGQYAGDNSNASIFLNTDATDGVDIYGVDVKRFGIGVKCTANTRNKSIHLSNPYFDSVTTLFDSSSNNKRFGVYRVIDISGASNVVYVFTEYLAYNGDLQITAPTIRLGDGSTTDVRGGSTSCILGTPSVPWAGIFINPITVASLPSAVARKGARYFVSDANATTFASVVAGGGANAVPVYSDGTNWRIG